MHALTKCNRPWFFEKKDQFNCFLALQEQDIYQLVTRLHRTCSRARTRRLPWQLPWWYLQIWRLSLSIVTAEATGSVFTAVIWIILAVFKGKTIYTLVIMQVLSISYFHKLIWERERDRNRFKKEKKKENPKSKMSSHDSLKCFKSLF